MKLKSIKTDYSRSAAKQQGEKEFFKLIVLSELVNEPDFIQQTLLLDKDPVEMYQRAKFRDKIPFYRYYEWI